MSHEFMPDRRAMLAMMGLYSFVQAARASLPASPPADTARQLERFGAYLCVGVTTRIFYLDVEDEERLIQSSDPLNLHSSRKIDIKDVDLDRRRKTFALLEISGLELLAHRKEVLVPIPATVYRIVEGLGDQEILGPYEDSLGEQKIHVLGRLRSHLKRRPLDSSSPLFNAHGDRLMDYAPSPMSELASAMRAAKDLDFVVVKRARG
jgi:hypothetical protein